MKKIIDFFKRWILPILIFIIGLLGWGDLSELLGLKETYRFYTFFILSLIAFGISLLHSIYVSPSLQKLEKEIKKRSEESDTIIVRIEETFNTYLHDFSKKYRFSNTERITVYIYDGNSKIFIPFGRYSSNATYKEKNKIKFSMKGCIGEGWKDGWYFDNNVTKTKNEKKYGYTEEEIKAFRMKSKLYAVQRIHKGTENYGVIVIESTKKDFMIEDNIKRILNSEEEYISCLVSGFYDVISSSLYSKAIEKGF